MKELILKKVNESLPLMLDAERFFWEHPETGYNEWQGQEYLAKKFSDLGYDIVFAKDIPGFYADIDTGREGATLCIMGELDALDIKDHPESVNGACHACGHNVQSAVLLGIAKCLKDGEITDKLSGRIRLMATPAEEMIQLEYRRSLMAEGKIRHMGGKTELMRRGFFDGVDLSIMVHANTSGKDIDFDGSLGSNGCMAKVVTYKGKASHAGGAPHCGVNALYAASLGLQACNSLRETFREQDRIRFHPILKGIDTAVNIIPDKAVIESYVRGRTMEAIIRENKKLNRALAASALAIGANVDINDIAGYYPEFHSEELFRLTEKCCKEIAGEERVRFNYSGWGTASSDFGDVTAIMPGMQFNASGAEGECHGVTYKIAEPERICRNSAHAQLYLAYMLLKDESRSAKEIVAAYKPDYPSVAEYIKAMDAITKSGLCVSYGDNEATVRW